MDFYGAVLGEAQRDFSEYKGATPLHFHGPVSQAQLADAFRSGSVLVLPSLEEGFGLVVPQALACGLPVIVSDRVGAKDLVRHRDNGSVFPTSDATALAEGATMVGGSSGPRARGSPLEKARRSLSGTQSDRIDDIPHLTCCRVSKPNGRERG